MIAKKKILFGIFAIAIVVAAGWLILSYPTEVVVNSGKSKETKIYPGTVGITYFDDYKLINNTASFLIQTSKPLTEEQIATLRNSGVRKLSTSEIGTVYHSLIEENKVEEVEELDFVEDVYPYKIKISDWVKQPTPTADDTEATPEKVNAVVNANNQFAFELYSKYKDESREDNIFFSPYSISTALAMTYEGARGKTSGEMQSVFHFPADNDVRRPAFAKIYNEINKKEKGKQYKLHTANALWAQKDCQFTNEYFGTTEKYYRGKVTNLDFRSEPEPSRITINNWVEDQTNDKIKDLIPPGGICPLTRLVLTNAIYFKGTWVLQFDKNKTREADFGVSPTKTVKVEMMSLTGEKAKFNYAETAHLQILEMPYEGEELSMIVLLPKEDTLDKLEQSLTVEKLNEWRGMLQKERVDVYMPKFKFETKYFMAQDLAEMGMPSAFTGEADFSGMTGKRDLYISQVIHQAFVEVNEEGTEAAAATAVIMERGVVMSKVFRADHPFIFIIQQKDTGNILFLGKVVDPAK